MLQSIICLTQATGMNLGYIFKFSAHGPISKSLTDRLKRYLTERREFDLAAKTMVLKPGVEAKLEVAKALIEPPKTAEGVKYIWLKVLSSMYMYVLCWPEVNQSFTRFNKDKTKKHIASLFRFTGYAFLNEAWERLEEFFGKK